MHLALGSTRIMSTCMALGEAAGAAAMLSLHEEVTPRELNAQLLRNLAGFFIALLDFAEHSCYDCD